MNYSIFKLNNYVEYSGKLTNQNKRVGVITSVDRCNDEDTFELTLMKRYPMDTEIQIRAYLGEVIPIALTEDFLKKNNFQINAQKHFFNQDNIVIYRPMFIKKTHEFSSNQDLCLDDKGFRVINSAINDYSNESEVLEKTTSIHSVNALQNYFEAALGRQFEVNWS